MTDQAQPVAEPKLSAAQLIALYIQVRDQKSALAEQHQAQMKPLNDAMEMLDSKLLEMCIANGTDAVKVKGIGSATKSLKESCSIENPEDFKKFVIDNERWDMVSWSAKTEETKGYVQEHGALPPGVKISSYMKMSVRRAPKGKSDE